MVLLLRNRLKHLKLFDCNECDSALVLCSLLLDELWLFWIDAVFSTVLMACMFGFHLSSTATWPLDPSKDEKHGWRHIRIKQMGKNASGQTHYLSLSGLEIYGTVTGVCEDQLGKKCPCRSSKLLVMFIIQ